MEASGLTSTAAAADEVLEAEGRGGGSWPAVLMVRREREEGGNGEGGLDRETGLYLKRKFWGSDKVAREPGKPRDPARGEEGVWEGNGRQGGAWGYGWRVGGKRQQLGSAKHLCGRDGGWRTATGEGE